MFCMYTLSLLYQESSTTDHHNSAFAKVFPTLQCFLKAWAQHCVFLLLCLCMLQWLPQIWWIRELRCGIPLSGSPRVPLVLRGASRMGWHPRAATMRGERWTHSKLSWVISDRVRWNCWRPWGCIHSTDIPYCQPDRKEETRRGAKIQEASNYPRQWCDIYRESVGKVRW